MLGLLTAGENDASGTPGCHDPARCLRQTLSNSVQSGISCPPIHTPYVSYCEHKRGKSKGD